MDLSYDKKLKSMSGNVRHQLNQSKSEQLYISLISNQESKLRDT
jgi:hypothetical protein